MQTAPLTIQAMISRAQPHYFAIIRMKHPSVGLQENMRLKMKTDDNTQNEFPDYYQENKQQLESFCSTLKAKMEPMLHSRETMEALQKANLTLFCYALRRSNFISIACLWKNVRSVQELRT